MTQNRQAIHPLIIWENSITLSQFVRAFFSMCSLILFKPADFFRQLIQTKGIDLKRRVARAILFALVLGYLKLLFDVLNLYWLKSFPKEVFGISFSFQANLFSTAVFGSPFFFLRPVLIFMLTLALVVAGVKLVLGFDKVLLPALLVVCYKSVADVFYCIPIIGGFFAAIWSLALIIIGIRHAYAVDALRALFSAVVMPFMILFFVILSMGTSLNKAILALYPETSHQIAQLNDLTAYAQTAALVSAVREYKKELGFYPANLGLVKKYLTRGLSEDVTRGSDADGYVYEYSLADQGHFSLTARPSKVNETGRFIFYADETQEVRLNNKDGLIIRNIKEMEVLLGDTKEKPTDETSRT